MRVLIAALVVLFCPVALVAVEAVTPDPHVTTTPAPVGVPGSPAGETATSPHGDTPVPTDPAIHPADPVDVGSSGGSSHVLPALTTVNAGRGGSISLSDKDPSTLLGGVDILYEKVHVLCDHLSYWQAPLAGTAHAQLSRVLFSTGPEAVDHEHIIFDTRTTKLPMIGFHGLMTPTGVEVLRQPLDPLHPKQVTFQVQLHGMEDFAGLIQTSAGWKPHAGWADDAEATIIADIVPAGLITQRFASLVLHGRPAKDGEARRRARLERLKEPIPPGVALSTLHAKSMDWWVESKTITILFDATGRASQVLYDQDFHGEGTPSLDMPIDKHSQPALDGKTDAKSDARPVVPSESKPDLDAKP